jgi:CheY-like chemotaxis protein
VSPNANSKLATDARLLQGRILVVDDNPDHRSLLKLLLSRAGAEVIVAENGRQAFEIVERALRENQVPIDLVVTDMMMPEMNGAEFAQAIRLRGWKLPLIACSAAVMSEEQAASLSAGCNDFVSKPIRRQLLLETCRRWMKIPSSPKFEAG